MYWPFAAVDFPIRKWLPEYTRDLLAADLSAGLTVFVFLIPQGMAYSLLAGLPPIYGLYSSIVPLYCYAVLGTSRQLSIGPMAITSLLLGVSTQRFGYDEDSEEYINTALNISMVVGIVVTILGFCKLGSLANLISHSVLVGFLTASALVIAINQVKYLFGFSVPRFPYTHETIVYILTHLPETNINAVLMGFSFIAVLYYIKGWRAQNKPTAESSVGFKILYNLAKMSNFIAIFVSSFIARSMLLDGHEIEVVGDVPSGLKAPSFSSIGFTESLMLIPSSLAIAFVAFAGNWAVAKKYGELFQHEVDATQELFAEGISTVVGVLFNAYVVSGGLARSAVNAESGAQTQIAGCVVASLMLIAVQFLTSLFYYIPMCVLAAIIEVSIVSMVDFTSMRSAYKLHKKDCLVMVCTFFFTFFLGVAEGLYVGIGISIAIIIHTTAFPTVVHIGKLPDSDGGYYKNIARYPQAHQFPGIAIVRMDATLTFANCGHFKDKVKEAAKGMFHTSDEPIHLVVIDASPWIDLDLSGVKTLFEIKEDLRKMGNISLAIALAKGRIRDCLQNCEFACGTKEENTPLDLTLPEAVQRGYTNIMHQPPQGHDDDHDDVEYNSVGTSSSVREVEMVQTGGLNLRKNSVSNTNVSNVGGSEKPPSRRGSAASSVENQDGLGRDLIEQDLQPSDKAILENAVYL